MSSKDKIQKVSEVGKQPKDIEMPPFPFQVSEPGTRSIVSKSPADELDSEEKRKLRDALQNVTIAS